MNFIHLTSKSKDILESIRLQDINHLINQYRLQTAYELIALILLLLFILFYIIQDIWKSYQKPPLKTSRQQNYDLTSLKPDQFASHSYQLIRSLIQENYKVDNQSMTDIELIQIFQKTPLKDKSIEVISLLDKSLYGKAPLEEQDRAKIQSFIQDLSH